MPVLNLLGLLLVSIGSTRSATIESESGEDNPLGSCQANVASRIAFSIFSVLIRERRYKILSIISKHWFLQDAKSSSQDCAMFDGEKHVLKFPEFEFSTTGESKSLQGNTLLASDVFNNKGVAQFGERSSINEFVQFIFRS
uniref:Uncharacterized protein n=1 Tax=Spongospora subterranea TaxID=70186 RepID=A0A0H5QYD9_9EUKA|eukprot:CRZ06997.1 hypothetical protein [Spongospora subterranea]